MDELTLSCQTLTHASRSTSPPLSLLTQLLLPRGPLLPVLPLLHILSLFLVLSFLHILSFLLVLPLFNVLCINWKSWAQILVGGP